MVNGKLGTLSRFPKVFWVVQTFEILERGAYYSMMPIVGYHAIYNVGLPIWLGLIITVFMYPFQYGLPIFTGALAEKVGYKRQIIFAFSFLTFAYILLTFAFNIPTMLLAVVAIGIGIGSYKPLISSTVAKCTTSQDRNLAYAIYYWFVNLAAFVLPGIFTILIVFYHIISSSTYYLVFLAGAVLVSVNIFTALFIFEEVPRSGQVKTVGDAVNNIKIAMKDKKFVVMVFLIGGFWGLYSTMLIPLPIILVGFRRLPSELLMALGVINPLVIIAAGIPLAKFIEKVESMRVVLAGIMIYLMGLSLIGFTLQMTWVIVGIVIASVGEFIVAPGYMAFVSKLAPKEKVSAYVGCNFISYMIGLLGGTFVFGMLATIIATEMEMPHFFYGVVVSFGLALLIAFTLYYWTWGQDIIKRAQKIKELEEGTDNELKVDTGYREPLMFRIFDKKTTVFACMLLIPVILISTFSMGALTFYGPEEDEEEIPPFIAENYNIIPGISDDFGGNLNEGGTTPETFNAEMEENNFMQSITFELRWQDEEDIKRVGVSPLTWENQPDEFSLTVTQGENFTKTDRGSNTHGSEGSITITFDFEHDNIESTNGTGEWLIEITLVNCGDFTNPPLPTTYPDSSNSFDLSITTEIYTPKE